MENASKALLIAGGIVITVLIFSLFSYTILKFQEYDKSQEEMLQVEKLTEFNLQFTNFGRSDLKGYELLTLVNKVVDYNQRYSDVVDPLTDTSPVGNSMGFSPITVNIKLDDPGETNKRDDLTRKITVPAVAKNAYKTSKYSTIKSDSTQRDKDEKTYDGKVYRLFGSEEYIQSDAINQFKSEVLDVIYGYKDAAGTPHDGLEKKFGGSIKAQNLVKTIGTIFEGKVVNYNGQPEDDYDRRNWYQQHYIENRYKTLTGKNLTIDDIRAEANVKDILQYYEFVEFRKAEFKCTGITYNQNTGRVASLSFEMK